MFIDKQGLAESYPVWLKQIATRSGQQQNCLRITGHTSRIGPRAAERALVDDSSAVREAALARVHRAEPRATRSVAVGACSAENIVGLGTDDARDALDRRVEFNVVNCPA